MQRAVQVGRAWSFWTGLPLVVRLQMAPVTRVRQRESCWLASFASRMKK